MTASSARSSSASNGWNSTRRHWRRRRRSSAAYAARPFAARAPRGERGGAAVAYRTLAGGGRPGRHDHAGRRVADRQLPSRRGPDPADHDDLPPRYYRSCPSSRPGRSPASRACSAWPGRASRTATAASIRNTAALRARLPAGRAADDRRAVGGRDHAAHRADREPAARRRADRERARGALDADDVADRLLGVNGATRIRSRCSTPRAGPHAVAGVRRADRQAAARPGSRASRRRCVARRAAGAAGHRAATRSCATSMRARARRTSRSATSSRACG
jgi:hypothetical protein